MESPAKSAPENWDRVLGPNRQWFDLQFSELWKYRDLIYLFFRRDFVSTYKQTVLGPLWFVIQPLTSTLIYTVIFGQIAKLSTNGIPPVLFYMSGIVAWGYFSACLVRCSTVFSGNANIFSKIYFPRLTVPIASVISMTVNSALQFLMLTGFVIFFKMRGSQVEFGPGLLLIPVFVLQAGLMGIGFGCIVSALTTRYRDLQMALGFGMQLWMYASCVFYPRSSVEENLSGKWMWLFNLNPVVPIIEGFRAAMLGTGGISAVTVVITSVVSIVIFLIGAVVFHHVEKDFADTI